MTEKIIVKPMTKENLTREFKSYDFALNYAKRVQLEENCKVLILRFENDKCWCKTTMYPKKVGDKK